MIKEGWLVRYSEEFHDQSQLSIYVSSLKIITETMSTVGYGMEFYPLEAVEMLFLMYVIIFHCNQLFTIFFQISQLRVKPVLSQFIYTHQKEMEQYISQIEERCGQNLKSKKQFDLILTHSAYEFLYSTKQTFASHFY